MVDTNTWVRKRLQELGANDQDIGWDNKTGYVMYQGKPLVKATETGGRSYAPISTIDSAWSGYGRKYPTTTPDYSARDKEIADTLAEIRSMATSRDSYDVQSDPSYQAAVKASESNVAKLSDRALGLLHARGRIGSSAGPDRLGEIVSDESARLAALIPGLEQTYAQRQQNQIGNLTNLTNMLLGLQNTAQEREYRAGEQDYRTGRDTIEDQRQAAMDALAQAKWSASPESDPRYKDLSLRALEADIAATGRSNRGGGGSGGGLTAKQKYDISQAEKEELNADKAALMDQLEKGEINRDTAITKVQNQYRAGIISLDYANELLRTIDVVVPASASGTSSYGTPVSGTLDRSTLESLINSM